ncbi:MAG: hypothetical protein NC079_03430 [Clostridium sp.]|nr:hypothetical protein [Acetatifactor muris]MCM1526207.1 hypothetical protein [Bacteroides sp.]MCM1562645.1 hypothetical protein [Clostridium sp.]
MTDSEKLDLLLTEMQGMKTDIADVKADLEDVKTDIADVKADLAGVKTDLEDVKTDLEDVKTDLEDVKTDLAGVKTDLEDVKTKVTKIDLTLENEIRVNIQRVAEGHLDLSRNMHEVMKPNNEIEMLAIKVRMLETDVRELKSKIS